MKSYKILSRHTSMTDAVEAAGIDLSYNEPLARRDLTNPRLYGDVDQALVIEEDGEKVVAYVFESPDGLKLLNRYEPFHSALANTGFKFAAFNGPRDAVGVSDSPLTRKYALSTQKYIPELYVTKDF